MQMLRGKKHIKEASVAGAKRARGEVRSGKPVGFSQEAEEMRWGEKVHEVEEPGEANCR